MSKHRQEITGAEVAVIGMAGRFPNAQHCRRFWENLKNGLESICFFTREELEKQGVDLVLLQNPKYIKSRGAIEKEECFDALFFGYTPREATAMDPQIRLFHEVCWETLEDAGYNPQAEEAVIGLYAGASSGFSWQVRSALSGHSGWGASHLNDKDFLSTRVSYKLDLKGPCTVVQTACSTSLVAIHQAYRAVLTGECDMALAGGVSVHVPQKRGYLYQEGMIFSPDGHCRAFDAKPTGVVDGSGIGIVLLKRLKKASKDHDHIYALVKGTSINNDGERKIGFTAPGIEGQAEVIRTAQRLARVEPESITYIEAHGTGTDLGDQVEIEALKLAFNTNKKGFCGIGSVKTNMGHLDAAAGVTGFIKTVLALKHREIPPSLHFETPNPRIDFENSPFYVVSRLTPWQSNNYPLRAGVSSFGIGGTNAHIILEEFIEGTGGLAPLPDEHSTKQYQLILLSAKTPTALDQMTENLVNFLKENRVNPGNPVNPGQNPGLILANAAYTLQVGRKSWKHRKMLVSSTVDQAVRILSSPGSREIQTHTLKDEDPSPEIIFMFPGQGAQYVNMGRELYDSEPIFHQEMERCFEILIPLMGDNIKEILYPGDLMSKVNEGSRPVDNRSNRTYMSYKSYKSYKSHINQTQITQPVIFVFEYALARVLMHWGIKPHAMIGHSIGEYVAACLSGVLSLQDGLRLVAHRGRLMQQLPVGAMLSVTLTEADLLPLLKSHPELALAAVNSSSLCVVSGPHLAIDAFFTQLSAMGIQARHLHTSHAFHSKMMEPILDAFEAEVKQVPVHSPKIPYISNVTGDWLTPEQAADPRYWCTHLRRTIRFSNGIEKILEAENVIFVEVGPGQVLSTFVRKNDHKRPGQKVINLVRHPQESVSDQRYLIGKLGQLWLYGLDPEMKKFHQEQPRQRISLPTYPFESKLYRLPPPQTAGIGQKPDTAHWFYIPQWKRSMVPAHWNHKKPFPVPWLVFMDDRALGTQLLEALEEENHNLDIIVVKKGDRFERVSSREFIISPGERSHYDALWGELHAGPCLPHQVVHLWGITGNGSPGSGPGAGKLTIEALKSTLDSCFYSLVYLAQAIGKLKIDHNHLFYVDVVTDHMQEIVGCDGQYPEKAVLLGPIKIIPQEYPNIRCRSIDIISPEPGSAGEKEIMRRLKRELILEFSHQVMALRGNYCWVQTVEPVRLQKPRGIPRRLKPGGVYLITGGLGGIGLVLAQHLVDILQAKVVLSSRTAFPQPHQWQDWLDTHDHDDDTSIRIGKLQEMQHQGEVLVIKADVTRKQDMQQCISRAKERFGHINGVIHAAGVADGGMIQQRTPETIEPILAPKLQGTLVLDALLKQERLDFLLFCSSLSSILAPFGQVAYCSGNAFLDAFAFYRNSHCRGPGTDTAVFSINWSAWKEVGMAVDTVKQLGGDLDTALKNGISPEQGIEIFDRILDTCLPQVAISVKNLALLLKLQESHGSKESGALDTLNIKREHQQEKKPGHGYQDQQHQTMPLHQRPDLTTPYIEPGDQLEKTITEFFQDFLGLEKVGIDDNFFELGASSLDLILINNKVKEVLNKEVPIVTMFTYSSIRTLTQYLRQEESAALSEKEAMAEPQAPKPPPGPGDLLENTIDLLKDI